MTKSSLRSKLSKLLHRGGNERPPASAGVPSPIRVAANTRPVVAELRPADSAANTAGRGSMEPLLILGQEHLARPETKPGSPALTDSSYPRPTSRPGSDVQVPELAPAPATALTLDSLEQAALANNPTLAQASAIVDALRGRQVQVGLYPNPTLGYLGTEMGNEGRAGQQGLSFSQEIVRGGKLQLNRAVLGHDVEQAEARLEAQRYRVLNAVRTAYFSTLAAERGMALTKDLEQLAARGLGIAEELLRGGQGTRPEVLQAQIELEQVRILAENAANNYRASWKRLAAVVGRSDIQAQPLAGDLEEGISPLSDEELMSQLLARSPELRAAEAGVRRAVDALARARVEPIPNMFVEASTQYDYATRDTIASVGVSLPLPIFNRNQGNIAAAEAELVRATRDVDRVRLLLSDRLASSFARYANARQQSEKYRDRILPSARETLELTREGYQRGEFPFLQVLVAQRTLNQASISYLQALAELRTSIVELQGLLLTDGLAGEAIAPVDGFSGTRD